jgi:hypothetical protein
LRVKNLIFHTDTSTLFIIAQIFIRRHEKFVNSM